MDCRRAQTLLRPAVHRNSAAAASDRGSLPDTALRDLRSCEEAHRVAQDLNHAIDLFERVVEIETRARCPRQTELLHQRLIAMMPAAQGESLLVGEGRQVVRMDVIH